MFTKDEIFSSSELVINVVLRSAFQDTYKGTRYELILSLKATSTSTRYMQEHSQTV